MALRYGYFDSEITGTDSEGMPIFDRAENSELFALLFAKLVTNGVLASPADCFQVLAGDSGLSVKVRPGFAMIRGRFAYDASENVIALDTAPTSNSRIDWIVLRCNYKDRLCEIVAKTGTAATTPAAPDLLQPASGDYYELGLAKIAISANQTTVSQSNITDTRADSTYCGYITQLIDHLDTSVFFAQLNAFYKDFVDKSAADYKDFQSAIDDYIAGLKSKGDTDLAATEASMKEFQSTSQTAFTEWFNTVKSLMDGDVGTKLTKDVSDLTDEMELFKYMLYNNEFFSPVLDTNGNPILDSEGAAVLGGWKYQTA